MLELFDQQMGRAHDHHGADNNENDRDTLGQQLVNDAIGIPRGFVDAKVPEQERHGGEGGDAEGEEG